MDARVMYTGKTLGHASEQLLSNNIEAYENTIPSMLSDRLRNPKFAGPENMQTGLAAEWEPVGFCMPGYRCRLVPGMFLSGTESQLVHNFTENTPCAIVQAGLSIRAGEEFEIEMWARAQDTAVTITVELKNRNMPMGEHASATLSFPMVHWQRATCRLSTPLSSDEAELHIIVPGDSTLVIDQIHMRPVGQTHVCQEMLDSFDSFPCPVLRFPGGCVVNSYHWEYGTGPVHLRPIHDDPEFKYKVHYDFGTDEYLALCIEKHIRPFITLNIATTTPEQGAAWAAYVREWYASRNLPIPEAYIMVGNEHYYFHEPAHMTGDMYIESLKVFTPLLREAYPEARIIVISQYESTGLRESATTPMRSVLLEKGDGLFDVMGVTRYSNAYSNTVDMADNMQAIATRVAEKQADLAKQLQTITDAGKAYPIAIAEWNFWTRASHHDHAGFYEPNDIRHCLYAAGYLNAFCRVGDQLEMACYYSLVNTMGMINVHNGNVVLSDVVKVFNLYEDALPGETLDVTVDAPAFVENMKMLDANFVRKGDVTYGFLVNFSSTDSVDVSLEGLGSIREATGLHAEAILQPVKTIDVQVSGACVTVPPMSLVRVAMIS